MNILQYDKKYRTIRFRDNRHWLHVHMARLSQIEIGRQIRNSNLNSDEKEIDTRSYMPSMRTGCPRGLPAFKEAKGERPLNYKRRTKYVF